jgi:DNA-binding transcriptional ArsR family regulator
MNTVPSPTKKPRTSREARGLQRVAALQGRVPDKSLVTAAEICGCSVLHEDLVAAARKSSPAVSSLEKLGELFKLFGDPTRLRILSSLAATELCVCDLGEVLGMSQSSISHQLAQLRAAHLVKTRRAGKVVFYSLDDAHVGEILKVGLDHISERKERS